ncbi:hypothetical protein [Staphylococcus chromogenes]|uniref:hypothetical protein n=1 Tax=Staphylococcus chromogenes TaxID=46126 RepID=UPI002902FA85|nr:hypothetical protein [Staphylococcus chromogenes]MDU0465804.1 hypothetical protein [Staphylococcus chromogenes]
MTISKHERNRISELEADIESYKRIRKNYIRALDIVRSERNSLIEDIAKLREERDELIISNAKVIKENAELKRKLDEVVRIFEYHINYKLSVSHNTWYINLRHKLDEVLKDEAK